MSLPRIITIDTYANTEEGAYALITESAGQATIVSETEGCNSSFKACENLKDHMMKNGYAKRWCIARLVPVEGNELLVLDLERLQKFYKDSNK